MERTIDRPGAVEVAGSARKARPTFALWSAIAVQTGLAPVTWGTATVLSEYYSVPAFGWAIIAMYLSWFVAVVALIVTSRRRPLATPLIPLTNVALLVSFVMFGVRVLGWSA